MFVAREHLASLMNPDPAPILRHDTKLDAVLGPKPIEVRLERLLHARDIVGMGVVEQRHGTRRELVWAVTTQLGPARVVYELARPQVPIPRAKRRALERQVEVLARAM